MKATLTTLLIAGLLGMPTAQAQTASPSSASASASASAAVAKKKTVTKKTTKKAAAAAPIDEEAKEPDVSGTTVTEYQCELGNKLTIFRNNDDSNHIALKWGKRIHRLTHVDTSTGASRFENHYYGLVWIAIPAKGILLDSKNGHELANDCKTAEQLAQ